MQLTPFQVDNVRGLTKFCDDLEIQAGNASNPGLVFEHGQEAALNFYLSALDNFFAGQDTLVVSTASKPAGSGNGIGGRTKRSMSTRQSDNRPNFDTDGSDDGFDDGVPGDSDDSEDDGSEDVSLSEFDSDSSVPQSNADEQAWTYQFCTEFGTPPRRLHIPDAGLTHTKACSL
jgi:hypothetical protein